MRCEKIGPNQTSYATSKPYKLNKRRSSSSAAAHQWVLSLCVNVNKVIIMMNQVCWRIFLGSMHIMTWERRSLKALCFQKRSKSPWRRKSLPVPIWNNDVKWTNLENACHATLYQQTIWESHSLTYSQDKREMLSGKVEKRRWWCHQNNKKEFCCL